MSYKICSFNANNFSLSSSKNFDKLADLIGQFDIVVLQEVLSEGMMFSDRYSSMPSSLLRRLGQDKWDCAWVSCETRAKDYPFSGCYL